MLWLIGSLPLPELDTLRVVGMDNWEVARGFGGIAVSLFYSPVGGPGCGIWRLDAGFYGVLLPQFSSTLAIQAA